MSKHSLKQSIGLAGEFLVTGELLRRGIMATVTYGNAKKADVIAINGDKATSLEVKSTSENKWVLGGSLPCNNNNLWVLVYLPKDYSQSPQYFILTGGELRELLLPSHEAYSKRYRDKHGKDYDKNGVVSIKRELLNETHAGAWGKILERVSISDEMVPLMPVVSISKDKEVIAGNKIQDIVEICQMCEIMPATTRITTHDTWSMKDSTHFLCKSCADKRSRWMT